MGSPQPTQTPITKTEAIQAVIALALEAAENRFALMPKEIILMSAMAALTGLGVTNKEITEAVITAPYMEHSAKDIARLAQLLKHME